MPLHIRPFRSADLPELQRLTIEGFDGISIDQSVEQHFGVLAGRDWTWRKARQIDDDIAANPEGVFVALASPSPDAPVLGFISTRIDRDAAKGRIPNLAVDAPSRGQGIGRALIAHALDYLRQEGMAFVMIETMEHNPIGQHLYPSLGFVETGRQIHYALKL
jgi:ribosomal protein S18 acetylase RimI-like enzyme